MLLHAMRSLDSNAESRTIPSDPYPHPHVCTCETVRVQTDMQHSNIDYHIPTESRSSHIKQQSVASQFVCIKANLYSLSVSQLKIKRLALHATAQDSMLSCVILWQLCLLTLTIDCQTSC